MIQSMSEPKSLHELEDQLVVLQEKLRELKKKEVSQIEDEYVFTTPDGVVSLRQLFGDKDDLIVIQNMGKSCPYCTIYADGINGVLGHLENRCSVALLSPDPVDVQSEFAQSRGWKFRMVSSAEHGDKYSMDMGHWGSYDGSDPGTWPGFSAFRREGDAITRTGHSSFCPGDEFCVAFPMMQMLDGGYSGWAPKYSYGDSEESGGCCGG